MANQYTVQRQGSMVATIAIPTRYYPRFAYVGGYYELSWRYLNESGNGYCGYLYRLYPTGTEIIVDFLVKDYDYYRHNHIKREYFRHKKIVEVVELLCKRL